MGITVQLPVNVSMKKYTINTVATMITVTALGIETIDRLVSAEIVRLCIFH